MSDLFKALPPSTPADHEFRRAQIAFAHAVVVYEAELRKGTVSKSERELEEQVERLEKIKKRLDDLRDALRGSVDWLQGSPRFHELGE